MRFLAFVLALCLLPLLGCDSRSGSSREGEGLRRYTDPPNVILITIDTLRADHLSCYGYFRQTSPAMDALAAEGVLFTRAHSTSGTTLPSHLSIFTGLYPHQHGHTSNKGAMKGPYQPGPGRIPVSEYFLQAGYNTAAFVSGNTVKKATGTHHGFAHWDQPSELHRIGSETRERAEAWLNQPDRRSGQPFFLWVHFWDVHEPNNPPEPWRSLFSSDAQVADLLARRRVDAERLQAKFPPIEIARLFYPELVEPLRQGVPVTVPPIDHAKLMQLIDLYDASIRYVDDQIAGLLQCLKANDQWEQTIVAVAADHGQALGQHDWLEHGEIRGEETHIPLILRFAPGLGIAAQRSDAVVSAVDLMPTITSRMPQPIFREFEAQASGSNLLDAKSTRGWAFSQRTDREREWDRDRKYTVTVGRWRYYHIPGSVGELYNLELDPLEHRDIAVEHPQEVNKLERLVQDVLASRPADGNVHGTLSEEERRQLEDELRKTGYIGDAEDEGE